MEKKEFLDDNIQEIVSTSNAILEKYPSGRSEEMENELIKLWEAMDSYIIEYEEPLEGKLFGRKFETERIKYDEDEEYPVAILSTAYYMNYNLEIEEDEENYCNVSWRYDRNGQPDETYSMSNHYFPLEKSVKQYIETQHIEFDSETIKQIVSKYSMLVKENENINHGMDEIRETISDRKIEDINKVTDEISENVKDTDKDKLEEKEEY